MVRLTSVAEEILTINCSIPMSRAKSPVNLWIHSEKVGFIRTSSPVDLVVTDLYISNIQINIRILL